MIRNLCHFFTSNDCYDSIHHLIMLNGHTTLSYYVDDFIKRYSHLFVRTDFLFPAARSLLVKQIGNIYKIRFIVKNTC